QNRIPQRDAVQQCQPRGESRLLADKPQRQDPEHQEERDTKRKQNGHMLEQKAHGGTPNAEGWTPNRSIGFTSLQAVLRSSPPTVPFGNLAALPRSRRSYLCGG